MRVVKYKELLFYIIETKEDFFLNVTNKLYSGFRNHRLIQINESDKNEDTIAFYGTKKRLTYTASKAGFDEVVNVKHKFKINLN